MEVSAETGYYSEEALIDRAYASLEIKTKGHVEIGKKVATLAPAIQPVHRTTVFLNFANFCKDIDRPQQMVFEYLCREMGVDCSLNSHQQISFQRRVKQERLQRNLDNFCNKYVFCPSCKSKDTSLEKKNRMTFLVCKMCESSTPTK
jgi:translation initiation factor 2 subunit 2